MIGLDNTRKHLIVAGIDLTQKYGIWTNGVEVFNAPAYEYTKITIPGRNGDLYLKNNRYPNIIVNYPCICRNFTPETATALKRDLFGRTGYVRIDDDRDPEHYRLGVPLGPFTVDQVVWNNGYAYFTLSFDCKPQRYYRNLGYKRIAGPVSQWDLVSNTGYQSAPRYQLSRSGGLAGTQFEINGMLITIRGTYPISGMDLDAETQTATAGSKNVSQYIYIQDNAGSEYDQPGVGIPYSDKEGNIYGLAVPSGLEITVYPKRWVL